MSTVDATDNTFNNANPEVITHESVSAGVAAAGGDTPRVFPRQLSSGNQRGIWNITGSITITSPTDSLQSIVIDGGTESITIAAGGSISIGTNIAISGANDSIVVTNTDGSTVGMGAIPDNSGTFGFFAQDNLGNLLYKIVGSTIYAYDITQNPHTNVIQMLKLPDGTYGSAVAKIGQNVVDAFS